MSKLAGAPVVDLVLEETFVLYHPEGRDAQSSGEQRVWIKVPAAAHREVMDGRRRCDSSTATGYGSVAPTGSREVQTERGRDRTHLLVPFRRSADDVLAEWSSFGCGTT